MDKAKKNWQAPVVDNLDINETQLSTQPERPSDGVYLGWLDQEGTDCDTCS